MSFCEDSKLHLVVLFVLASLVLVPVNPLNLRYPAAFNFGDSNSDTGGLVAGVAYPVGPPNGQTFFDQPSGRFCDGRLIVDFLMDAMELPFLNPYLDSVGAPSFQKGCNFAAGGGTILPKNASSIAPFSFGIQVSQFIRFKARVLELMAKGNEELQKYLPFKDDFGKSLYMIDLGQNDLHGALYPKSEEQVVAFIPTILAEFESGIKRLYTAGARHFWIHNTGPLGCLAHLIDQYGNDTSNVDELGCMASHNRIAVVFNSQLYNSCRKFQQQFPDTDVTYVDIYSIKLNLIANYSKYGFKEPIAACCGHGGPPLNFDSRVTCWETKNVNGSSVTASPCENAAKYVSWDGAHLTEAANMWISEQILMGNYSYTFLRIDISSVFNCKFINMCKLKSSKSESYMC